ncbi:MAG: FtsX-like permease family protein [Bacteroidetes bacterium]|nr:FtsX-like permease family protein [Bacteroidota bacterium]
MLRHYFIIAIRNIARYWKYSVINIGGLAIGLASFAFILIYISDELKYDKFHENADRIYRVNRLYNSNNVDEDAATCSFPFAPALEFDYPDIVERTVRFFDFQVSTMFFEYREGDSIMEKFNEKWFYLADSTVFDVFTFPFIEGNPETALDRPNTIVITESTAKRYFGDESSMGKTLRLEEGVSFEITGVLKDIPSQSHFKIDLLGSLSTFRQLFGGSLPETWIWNPCWTYVLLHNGIDPEILEEKFPQFYLNHYPDLSNQDVTLYLQSLADIHLKSHHDYEMHPNSNIIYVRILSVIAGIVLILACINFMNLATATSVKRAKEIGMKKVFGGSKRQLSLQFIGEAVILSFIAMIFAGIVVELLLSSFNNFTGKTIPQNFFLRPETLFTSFILILIVGLLSGTYPAFFLSSFKPILVLKGNLQSGLKTAITRKILVIFQFSVSISLIIGTLMIFSQLKYMRNTDLGFKKDQIITIPTVGQIAINYETFKNMLLDHPDIHYVTGMEDVLGVKHNTRQVVIEGLDPKQGYWFPMFMVRHDFIETFGVEVVEGMAFSKDKPTDTVDAIMINETMVKNLGWTNEEAIGKKIRSDGDERVIGVFKDFHILSLHEPINNFILDMLRNPQAEAGLTRYIAIRVNTKNYKKLLGYIEEKWKELAPTRPFEFSFFDKQLDNQYTDEDKFGKFSVMLTILALIIASLGLIGLTSFVAEQRTQEIGIRRALGANVTNVIKLLSNEFIFLIFIAYLIACPAAYFFTNNWLQNFSKHISINLLLFLLSGIIALIIGMLIIAHRAFWTSLKNPAETLRYE